MPTHYWITDSLSRTKPDTPYGTVKNITLYAGRRMTVACQINAFRDGSTVHNQLRVDDDDGLVVTVYKEHYVYVTNGSAQHPWYYNQGEGPGWYPDGLTPVSPPEIVELSGNTNQPFWVDIFIPPDTTAGTKVVEMSIASTYFTITVIVGDFTLPERVPSAGSLFRYIHSPAIYDPDANDVLRDHWLMPMYTEVADSRKQDWVSCSFYTEKDSSCQAVQSPPSSQDVADKKALLAPVPSTTKLYSYTMDEIGSCADNAGLQATMATWYAALNANDVLSLITMPPHVDWYNILDIAVVLLKFHNQANLDAWLAAGNQAWVYQCLLQDQGTPKWLLDFTPLNYRIHGFLMQVMGYTGVLYWACDDWTADPWNDVEMPVWGGFKPGEGMLVYPATGTPEGDFPGTVLPSMRLKQMRDAMQDYELVEAAKNAGKTTEAMAIIATVGSGFAWGEWSNNPQTLHDARKALVELLSPPPTPPTAEFVGSPLIGTTPLTVNFNDLSEASPTSWHWEFGDGGESYDKNPSHEYTSAGIYTVKLTATNSAGSDAETKVAYVAVSDAPSPPIADFSADPVFGTVPLMVNFTNLSQNETGWYWEFGDGGDSPLENPSHEYTSPGVYTVTLTASNATDEDVESKVDLITVEAAGLKPLTQFNAEPLVGKRPLKVNFIDQSSRSPTSWLWDFGDGRTSTEQNPTHYYQRSGVYTVTLTSTNTNGSNVEVKTDYIVVEKKGPTRRKGRPITTGKRPS